MVTTEKGQYGKYSPRLYPSYSRVASRYGSSFKRASLDQQLARRADGYRGRGDYKSVWKDYRSYVPRAIGAAAGLAATRSLTGAAAGWGHGANLSKNVLGWGDYGATVGNEIMGGGAGPMSVNEAQGDMTGDVYINHREFVKDIYSSGIAGSAGFKNEVFRINPGVPSKSEATAETKVNTGAFPFLLQLAQNYTLFEFQGLIFEYRPMSGEMGSSSNSLGTIIMATDYDATQILYPGDVGYVPPAWAVAAGITPPTGFTSLRRC